MAIDEQKYKALINAVQEAVETMESGRIQQARDLLEGALLAAAKVENDAA